MQKMDTWGMRTLQGGRGLLSVVAAKIMQLFYSKVRMKVLEAAKTTKQ
jgi:hypothetical protein